jgi:hypothetical protein
LKDAAMVRLRGTAMGEGREGAPPSPDPGEGASPAAAGELPLTLRRTACAAAAGGRLPPPVPPVAEAAATPAIRLFARA